MPEDVLSLASEAEHAVRQMIPDKTRTRAENVNIVFMSFRYVVENSLLLRLLFPDSVLHGEFTKCFLLNRAIRPASSEIKSWITSS